MKKLLITLMTSLFITSTANAEIQTYEGSDEYYVLGAVENINVARERARERAIRNAREKAGIYIHSYSRTKDFELIEDEIISVASGVLRIIETYYETEDLPDSKGYLIRATVKADIDTDDLRQWLHKDIEEISKIVAQDKAIRAKEQEQERKIETLKQEYVQAETHEQKEVIVQQIMHEDNVFLSNLKLREGNSFHDAGDYKRAAELFSEAIKLNPENALAWNNRGLSYAEQKKYQQALTDFNRATELDPNSDLPYSGRGLAYYYQKKYSAAIKEYTKVIELNPNYAVAYNNRGAAYSWQGNMREAVVDYSKAIELNPNYAKAYENRGKAYSGLGENKKSAEDRERSEHIRWSNKNADKIIAEALALCKRGEIDAALSLYNQAAESYPDNRYVYINRGNLYNNELKDYETAIADYNEVIEISPNFSWAYYNRGIAYERMGRLENAVADYSKAIEMDTNYAMAYNNRAWTYSEMGLYDKALPDINKALKLQPNEVTFYDTRACIYKGLKKYKEALADIDKAIKISAEGWLYNRRGEIYQEMGDDAKAQSDFAKARELGYRG